MRISASSHFLEIAFAAERYPETVHFAYFVSQDRQFSGLLRQNCRSRLAVAFHGATKDEKAIADCADDLFADLDADLT